MTNTDNDKPAGDRYTLQNVIGEGGMALVYQATDNNLDRGVAVKILRGELSDDAQYVTRFREEARIMGRLDHPGSIPVYEAGETEDGAQFLSMKRVHGRTLEEMLDNRDADQLKDHSEQLALVDIFEKICQTVAAAHRQGIIHRDLKPDNIMIDDLGEVYVMDWGIAKQIDSEPASSDGKTMHGVVMGTPAYMSPELAMGKAAESDRQSDVFSLGSILYEVLTGVQPFKKDSAMESMKGVMYHDPDEPRSVARTTNRALSAICMKALNKDPYRRYRDAGELALDIRAFREFRPVSAAKYGMMYRLWAWHHRRPALSSTLATLAAVVLIAAVGVAVSSSIDNVFVALSYAELEELDSDIKALEEKIAQYDRQIAAIAGPSAQRDKLQRLRDGSEQRIMFKQRMITTLSYSIGAMTMFSRDEEAENRFFEIIRQNVDRAIEQGNYHLAHEMLGYILSTAGTPRNPFNLNPDELAEVRRRFDDVEAKLDNPD